MNVARPSKKLVHAARQLLGASGVRHGLRWFMRQSAIPQSWRDMVHRKVAKRAQFAPGLTFEHPFDGNTRLRFLLHGTATYLFWRGDYEPATTSTFAALATRAQVILDIGAADGIYAILAAVANPAARVLAFEPGAAAAEICARNLELNSALTNKVQLHCVALGDEDTHAVLYVAGESGGTSSLDPQFRATRREQQVLVRRVDTVLRDAGIHAVDLVKIDTEATEPAVLAGMLSTLARDKPDLICEVLAGRTETALERILAPLGYRYYAISSQGLMRRERIEGDATYRCPNYLFTVRDEARLHALGIRFATSSPRGI